MPWKNLSISLARSLTRRTFFPLRLVSTPKLSRRFVRLRRSLRGGRAMAMEGAPNPKRVLLAEARRPR